MNTLAQQGWPFSCKLGWDPEKDQHTMEKRELRGPRGGQGAGYFFLDKAPPIQEEGGTGVNPRTHHLLDRLCSCGKNGMFNC